MANTDTLEATDSNFDSEVLQAELPVLVGDALRYFCVVYRSIYTNE